MRLLLLTALLVCVLAEGQAQYLYERVEKKYAPEAIKKDLAQLYDDLKKYHLNLTQFIKADALKTVFDSVQTRISDSLTAQQVYYRLLPVLSRIGDGHMAFNYFDPEKITPKDAARYILSYESPFNQLGLKFIDKKIFVLDHRTEGRKIPAGAEVISINGIKSAAVIDTAFRFAFSDGYNTTFKYFFLNERSLDGLWTHVFRACETLRVVYKSKNATDSVTLRGEPKTWPALKPDSAVRKPPFLNFKRLGPGTAYLKINTFEPAWDTADQRMFALVFTKEFSQTSHLILDLRGNAGGQQGLMLMFLKGIITKPQQPVKFPQELIKGVLLPPADTAKRNRLNYVKQYNLQGWGNLVPFNGSYRNPLYVLVNGGTFSAAAILAYALTIDKRAVLIGEETGGGRNTTTAGVMFHNHLKYTGLSYSFGLVPFNASDPVPETGHGVRPNIKTAYTIEDYLHNRDLEMEQALKLIEADRQKGK